MVFFLTVLFPDTLMLIACIFSSLLFELVIKIAYLQLLVRIAIYFGREYAKAVVEVAKEWLAISERVYSTRTRTRGLTRV